MADYNANQNQAKSAGFINITLNLPVKGGNVQPISVSCPVKHENVLNYLMSLSEEDVLKLMEIKSVNSSSSKIADLEFG